MKLECTIGTQGLPDGRRIRRGDVYEVDDETASTLIDARYAKVFVEPVAETPAIVEPEAVVEPIAEIPAEVEPVVAPIDKPSKTTRKKTPIRRQTK